MTSDTNADGGHQDKAAFKIADQTSPGERLGRLAAGLPRVLGATGLKIATILFQIFMGLLVWHLIVVGFGIDPRIVPSPVSVLQVLWAMINSGLLFSAMWITLKETVYGFVIGSGLGILLAVLLAEIKLLRIIFRPYIVALQAVPKVAMAPLFLIWFGFGIESKVALVVSILFFPVLVNTMAGLMAADEDQIDMMRAFRASRLQVLLKLKMYVAIPFVFAAFELSLVLAMTAAVVAEMMGSGTLVGLGTLIKIYDARMNSAGVYAVLILLSLLGVVLHWLVLTVGQAVSWDRR